MRLILTSLAAATLLLAASCTSSESTPTGGTDGLKIAYVRADSLTQLYDYHRELTEKFELGRVKLTVLDPLTTVNESDCSWKTPVASQPGCTIAR